MNIKGIGGMFSIHIYNVRCSERTRPKREFDSVAVNGDEGEKKRPIQNSKTIIREDIRNRYVKKRLFVIIIIFYPAKPNGIGDIVINERTRYFHNLFSRHHSLVFRFTSNTHIAYWLSLPPSRNAQFSSTHFHKNLPTYTRTSLRFSNIYNYRQSCSSRCKHNVAYAPLIVCLYS